MALRTFEDIYTEYVEALAQSGSGLIVDKSQGSFSYTLARAAASVMSLQDERLETVLQNSNPATATHSALDDIGSGYGIYRSDAQLALGYALITAEGSQQILQPQTQLIDLENNLSFFVTITEAVTIPTFTDIRVSIKAEQPGSEYNISAGKLLFCPSNLSLSVRVGGYKTSDGIYYGDLTGGQDYERDISYRNKILASYKPYSQAYLLQKLLEHPNVNKAFINVQTGGFVEVWVDSIDITYTSAQIKQIKDYTLEFCTPGIIPIIIQAKRKPVSIELKVKPLNVNNSYDDLTQTIINVTSSFFDRLTINETLKLDTLLSLLKPLVRSISFVSPLEDVVPLLGEVLMLDNVNINFVVK